MMAYQSSPAASSPASNAVMFSITIAFELSFSTVKHVLFVGILSILVIYEIFHIGRISADPWEIVNSLITANFLLILLICSF